MRLAQGQVRPVVAGRAAGIYELIRDPDRERADRAMEAMLQMGKLDIAELQGRGRRRPGGLSAQSPTECPGDRGRLRGRRGERGAKREAKP